jgi:hypothetical protein
MPISNFILTSGVTFTPETVATMGTAFEGAVDFLKIAQNDEVRREVVAKFIIRLAEKDSNLEAAALRNKALVALGDLMLQS